MIEGRKAGAAVAVRASADGACWSDFSLNALGVSFLQMSAVAVAVGCFVLVRAWVCACMSACMWLRGSREP